MRYSSEMNRIDVGPLTKRIASDPREVVVRAEKRYADEISSVCREVVGSGRRIVLLCGPSSSGKTTTSLRLKKGFAALGRQAEVISLDDFYRPQRELPHWPDGEINYESISGLDIPAFVSVAASLFKTGVAEMRAHDFVSDSKSAPRLLRFGSDSILIIEGLHALNPDVSAALPREGIFRLYVSPHTDFVRADGELLMPARELRLTRRIVRDYHNRCASAEITLRMWDYIIRGERKYIHPFRPLADRHIDTTHDYEPFLYSLAIKYISKNPIPPNMRSGILKNEGTPGLYKDEIFEVFSACMRFPTLSPSVVPADSLIREFIR